MPIFAKDGGLWKPAGKAFARDAGLWKPAAVSVRDAGIWKPLISVASPATQTLAYSTMTGADSRSFSFSSVSFGAPEDRVVYAAFSGARTPGPSPTDVVVTAGGATGSRVARGANANGEWWTDIYKFVPAVSSGTLTYSFSSGQHSLMLGVAVWSVFGSQGEHAIVESPDFAGTAQFSIPVEEGGVVIAAGIGWSTATPVWTGLDMNAQHRVETNRNFTAASTKTSGSPSHTFGVRWGTSGGGINLAAVSIF
ncbi:hypothetical protein [Aquibium microcysteis]|uniref:hypothetical protein n=1 Tax=Aquibium microcysteis TaxID=675281 RepID=UPI00165D1B9F|nr:hypothetical protein [Aquibium microcysteis]